MARVPDTSQEARPFTPEERVHIEVAKEFFWYFLEHVFIKSFEGQTYLHDDGTRRKFKFGRLHKEMALLMQMNPRTCILAPRAHLKSTLILAFAFWHMFKVDPDDPVCSVLYLSYKSNLAIEKVEELLRMIRVNSYCRFWRDLRPYGRTQVNYLVDFGEGVRGEAYMRGDGILSGTRGRHPKLTLCDDILSDFANPLAAVELNRITRVFKQSIMSLPANPDDPLILVGTPQSYDDILHIMANSEGWLWLRYPAIIDEKKEVVQWPDKFTYARLKQIQRSIGPTAFEVEFQLIPVSTTDQFFHKADILNVTDDLMPIWNLAQRFEGGGLATYAGFDVGRLVHPSHVSVFLELPDRTLIQIYHQFLDKMKYNAQVNLLNTIADVFQLSRGYFDSTFNALEDRGLSPVWYGKPFTKKLKADMATMFEKRVFAEYGQPGIILLHDVRQLNQIIIVNKSLSSDSTPEGHGDSFWSNGLAIKAAEDGPSIIEIGKSSAIAGQNIDPAQTWIRQLGVRS